MKMACCVFLLAGITRQLIPRTLVVVLRDRKFNLHSTHHFVVGTLFEPTSTSAHPIEQHLHSTVILPSSDAMRCCNKVESADERRSAVYEPPDGEFLGEECCRIWEHSSLSALAVNNAWLGTASIVVELPGGAAIMDAGRAKLGR